MLNRILGGVLGVAALAAALSWWHLDSRVERSLEHAGEFPFQIPATLEGDAFPRVPTNREFRFPSDHGPHDAYRTEWWYLTGTLKHREAPPLGLHLVFTRIALTARPQERLSAWATSEVYVAILILSNRVKDRPIASLRTSRAALGLAGAEGEPARIWIENWSLEQLETEGRSPGWGLHVATNELQLELELHNEKFPVHAGDLGEQDTENAPPFQFYVQPRMKAEGNLRLAGEHWTVDGVVSLEHAWGELPFPGGPVARDRFTLYLDDGRELLCIRSHRANDTGRATSWCVLVGSADGGTVQWSGEVSLDPVEYWSSERTRARYPIGWELRIPEQDLELRLTSYSKNEEVTLWKPVWTGTVRLHGTSATGSVSGRGLMQLNGYHD